MLPLVVVLVLLASACAVPGGDAAQPARTADASTGVGPVADEADGHSHDHQQNNSLRLREWTGSPVPSVELAITETPDGRRLLAISADGFTFTTADIIEPVAGEGHAHLYVDGELVTMIYKSEFVLPRLEPGSHLLTVTLSTNDHLEYASDREPITGTTQLNIAAPEPSPAADGADQVPESVAEPVTITLTIANGHLQEHVHLIPVPPGAVLQLSVLSDVTDHLEVPGYGIDRAVTPNESVITEFTADTPGLFDIHLDHLDGHTIQFEVG